MGICMYVIITINNFIRTQLYMGYYKVIKYYLHTSTSRLHNQNKDKTIITKKKIWWLDFERAGRYHFHYLHMASPSLCQVALSAIHRIYLSTAVKLWLFPLILSSACLYVSMYICVGGCIYVCMFIVCGDYLHIVLHFIDKKQMVDR